MGLFRRIAGILGFGRDDVNRDDDDDQRQHRGHGEERDGDEGEEDPPNPAIRSRGYQETGLPRRGFSVPVKVAVERPSLGPVLVPCNSGDGGVQGLQWCAKRLRIDEDGDVAHEFLDEVLPAASDTEKPEPKFAVRCSTRPAKVKNQVISHDGKVQHCVEHHGRLEWV